MGDYEALDLGRWWNAGYERWAESNRPASGEVMLRGLPFRFGAEDASAPQVLVLSAVDGAVNVPIGRAAKRIIVAHVLLEAGCAPGAPVALYRFRVGRGWAEAEIRARFEIGGAHPEWGHLPFVAETDAGDGLMARECGPWDAAGERQTEVTGAHLRHWSLFVWTPPGDEPVETLQIVPAGPAFAIGAVTLGMVDEHPFARHAAVPAVIETTDGAARPGHLDVDIDRGTATYAQSLPVSIGGDYVADALAGWGDRQNPDAAPAVSHISAAPSATLTVRHADTVLGRVTWREVLEKRVAEDGAVRVRLAEEGRNWVHVRVEDADSGALLPCRVHFRGPDGVPYAPHGHHAYANGNLGSWHQDVGGDVRLGQATYAYIDGTCQGWLPRGRVTVDAACGFEYEPLRETLTLAPGQRELTLRLRRVENFAARGWYSGDSHVHFLSTAGAHLEAAGEGLNVVNLLLSQWGHLFTNTGEFTGEPSMCGERGTIVYASQENRQHLLGHLTLLGLKSPVMPWCSDGPDEAELGGNIETTLSRWADACHAQGGMVVLPHMPAPNGEPAALIATGRVDAVEFVRHSPYAHDEWYRYLNAGYRLPLVGGTDKMTQDVPVGLCRTYAQLRSGQELSYDAWCAAVRGGRTFLSSGPLLEFTVDGCGPGDTLRLPGRGTVSVEAAATSIFPIHELQIIQQGCLVAASSEPLGAHRLSLRCELPVNGHDWLAARVAGPGYAAHSHFDGWRRGIMAHTSPVYVAVGADWRMADADTFQYMLTLVEGCLMHLRGRARQYPDDTRRVTHHHGAADHQHWLEEPFIEAREALHRRMHELRLPH